MKILKIELQNINSLKCEQPIVVDFTSDNFQDTGLFAITGPTGAGKTTILDAITIALYHNVPRFNKSNIKAGLEDVVSYGAEGALSRVIFQNKGISYEAHWSIRLTSKTGKRLAKSIEQVRLKNLDTKKILAEKKTDVVNQVKQITQLNYNQFLRSVLLAQGEFAAFLSAPAKDKGTLLEQITGEEIYKKIGETISSKIFEERRKLEKIQAKLNSEDLLSEEYRKVLEEEQKELTEQQAKFDKEIAAQDIILNWYKKEAELREQKEKLDKDKSQLLAYQESHAEKLVALSLHEKALAFKDSLTTLARLEAEHKSKANKREEVKRKTEKAKLEQTKASLQEETDRNIYLESEQEIQSWLPKLEEVTRLDAQIENTSTEHEKAAKAHQEMVVALGKIQESLTDKSALKEKLANNGKSIEQYLQNNDQIPEIAKKLGHWNSDFNMRNSLLNRILKMGQKQNQQKNQLQNLLSESEKIQTQLQASKEKPESLQKELEGLSASLQELDLDLLLKSQAENEDKKNLLKELFRWAERYSTNTPVLENLRKEISLLDEETEKLKNDGELLQKEMEAARQAVSDAEKIVEMEQHIKGFEEERQKLEPGKACSLCGSTHHPYVEEYRQVDIAASRTELARRKRKLDELISSEKKWAIESSANSTHLKNQTAQHNKLRAENEMLKKQFEEQQSQFSIEKINPILKNIQELEVLNQELSKKIKQTQALQKQKNRKQELLSKELESIALLEKKAIQTSEKSEASQQVIDQITEEKKQLGDDLSELEYELERSLSAFELELPDANRSQQFVQQLQELVDDFSKKEKQLAELNRKLAQMDTEILGLKKQNQEKSEALGKISAENKQLGEGLTKLSEQRKKLLPQDVSPAQKRSQLQDRVGRAKNKLDKAQEYLNQLKSSIQSLEKEAENIQFEISEWASKLASENETLSKQLEESNFNSRQELTQAMLEDNVAKQLSDIKKKLENRALELDTLNKKQKHDFDVLRMSKNFETSLDEATLAKATLQKQKEGILKRSGEISQRFELDNQIKERNRGVVAEINLQEKELKKWNDLMALTGGSKHAFNTYVQRLTLQNLIQLANIHLFKLNRRYSLKMTENYKPGEELNFVLIDHYQTDETRLVDTSSGGEKFLISLALALGLSDLASKNVSIDSLFIDEGFGTLDNHTLETVIAALETLQAQGKVIGIISHVENLKERIPTQIQVMKKSNGISGVKVV